MTLRHLRIFTEVYRAQSVTHAAEALHMTQPAVTRAVQELERHYGVRLFERMRRRLSPTEGGRRLYAQAVHLLDAFDRMETGLRDWDAQALIRVGATVTLGSTLVPQLARRFAREHPGIELRVTVANGDDVAAGLADNRLDVALLESRVLAPELHCEELGSDRLCVVLAPDHPLAAQPELTLEQLAACPLLVREQGSTARAILESALASRGLTLRPAWESMSTEALVHAAAMGLGAAVLPEEMAEKSGRDSGVCMRFVSDAPLRRSRVLAWHSEKYLTRSMRSFIGMCRDAAGQEENS